MPHQILISPDWASAEAWLMDLLAGPIRRAPLTQARVVVPAGTLVRHLEGCLLSSGVEGFFGSVFSTLSGLTREVLAEVAPDQQLVRIPEALRLWLIAGLVRQEVPEQGPMGKVRDFPGFVAAADGLIQELQEAAIAPEILTLVGQSRTSTKLQELGGLYASYHRMLRAQGWTDGVQEMQAAANAIRASRTLVAFDPLILYGFDDFTPARLEVVRALVETHPGVMLVIPFDPDRRAAFSSIERTLERLQEITGASPVTLPARSAPHSTLSWVRKQVFAAAPTRTAADDSLQVLTASGPAQMVEAIARQLRRLRHLDPGLSWQECAVIFRALPAYRPLIREIFPQFGIPFHLPTGTPWKELRVLTLLRQVLELKNNGFAKNTLLDCLRSAYCRVQVSPKALERLAAYLPAHAPPETLSIHLSRMATGLIRKAQQASEETEGPFSLGQEAADLRLAAAGVGGLARVVELPNRATLSAYAAQLAALAQDLIHLPALTEEALLADPQGLARDRRALAELQNRLSALGSAWPHEVTFAEFLALLDLLFQEEVLQDVPPRTDVVAIHDPLAVRGLSYRIAMIAGLLEKEFPAPVRPGPFLKEEERETLAKEAGPGAHLQARTDRVAKERLLFASALEAGRERVYLVYTETDARGRPSVVSPFVAEAQALIEAPEGLQQAAKYTTADVLPGDSADLWHPEEAAAWTLDQIYHREGLDPEGAALLANLLNQGRITGLAAGVARWHDPRFTAFDGDLSAQAGIGAHLAQQWAKRPLSPTKLDSFGKCPWQFFAGQILGLEGPEAERLEISPLDRGQLFHRILERFYRERWDQTKERARPVLATEEAEALAAIRQIAAEECERLQDEGRLGHPGAWRYEQERLMVRLGWFVHSEIEHFAKHPGLAPAHLEFSFGMRERRGNDPASTDEPLALVAGGGVAIYARGIIDRVDATADGQAMVIDYKTGSSVPTYAAVVKGISFQLFVYLVAAEQLLGLQPMAGFYLKLSDPPGAKGNLPQSGRLVCEGKPVRGKEKAWPDLKEQLLRFLAAYGTDIAAGHFPLLPVSFDLQQEPCRYCDFRGMCRQDRTRLLEGKQEDLHRFARSRTATEGESDA